MPQASSTLEARPVKRTGMGPVLPIRFFAVPAGAAIKVVVL